jgi:membrane protein
MATLLFVANTILTAYLAIARSRGVELLAAIGLRHAVMGPLEYTAGRILSFGFMTLLFYGVYRYVPARHVRTRTAVVSALFTSVLLELARQAFARLSQSFSPASLYSGTLAAMVIVVVWTYYASVIFIVGGEVGHVYDELRLGAHPPPGQPGAPVSSAQ